MSTYILNSCILWKKNYFRFFTFVSIVINSLIILNPVVVNGQDLSEQTPIKIGQVKFVGNTVFSDSELREIISPWEKKQASVKNLLKLRSRITDYYTDQGYISSGAFIAPQDISDGIEVQIIEGILADVEIEGLSRFQKRYITSRLPLFKPIKQDILLESLARLEDNALIQNLEANLVRVSLKENILNLKIEEENSLDTQLTLTNSFSPSIGEFGGKVNAQYHLFGIGDLVSINHTRTIQGGLIRYGVDYSLPINKYNGTIELNYTNAETEIVEEPISALDIQADLEEYRLALKQPVYLDNNKQLVLGIEINHIQNESFVMSDFSFAFVDGLSDGKSKITALRFAQEYFGRGSKSSLAVRSQFNLGINLFDATVTETGIDSLFWSWQGQAQWAKKVNDLLLLSTLNIQLTGDQLLPIEQISLGGKNTVRGYRQNLSIGDNGIIGNLELQIPLWELTTGAVILSPFIDVGTVWNNSDKSIESDTLASIGLGLDFKLNNLFQARLDYGFGLINIVNP